MIPKVTTEPAERVLELRGPKHIQKRQNRTF